MAAFSPASSGSTLDLQGIGLDVVGGVACSKGDCSRKSEAGLPRTFRRSSTEGVADLEHGEGEGEEAAGDEVGGDEGDDHAA